MEVILRGSDIPSDLLEFFEPIGKVAPDVLEWRPQGFSAAHFATWPEAIPERLIRMGTSERGCCPHCGSAWKRVVEKTAGEIDGGNKSKELAKTGMSTNGTGKSTLSISGPSGGVAWAERGAKSMTVGWQPSCACPTHDPTPCTVLDPFSGSGTTAKVAARLGRQAIGVDISAEYLGEITAARMGAGFQMEMIA